MTQEATRKIYVKPKDRGLFDHAAQIAKRSDDSSLSAIIAEALRRYIGEQPDTEETTFEKFKLTPGRFPNNPLKGHDEPGRPVRFIGKLIAQTEPHGRDENSGTTHCIYITKAGKLIAETFCWSRWQDAVETREVVVVDNLDELRQHEIPDGIIAKAEECLGKDPSVWID